jgi:hypothetical protein
MTDTHPSLYTTGEAPGAAEGLTIADGLFAIADALFGLACAVQDLDPGADFSRRGADEIDSDQGVAPIYDARELDED